MGIKGIRMYLSEIRILERSQVSVTESLAGSLKILKCPFMES